MSKSLLEEIQQSKSLFTQDFNQRCACVLRRNYYALEASSIKESFDSDVFSLYDDRKYDGVRRPSSHFTFNALSIDCSTDETPQAATLQGSLEHQTSKTSTSFDSVISNFKSFEENPINTNGNDKLSVNTDLVRHHRRVSRGVRVGFRDDEEQLRQVQSKVREINDLDYNVNSLIFKAVEVHTDILVMDATVTRLLAETRQLIQELDDVKFLDDLIESLRDIGPIVHREWKYTVTPRDGPIEQGVAAT